MKDNTQFIDPSKKSLYGKDGAQFWVGKIVAYADQKEQIEEGFGWRYKVRILGDNSNTDQVLFGSGNNTYIQFDSEM